MTDGNEPADDDVAPRLRAEIASTALRRSLASAPPQPAHGRPKVGDVRRLDPMDFDGPDSRLVYVAGVDELDMSASVLLLSPEVQMAASDDRLLGPSVTGFAFALLALCDVQAPVWFVQLGPVLASFDVATLSEAPAGPELLGRDDDRWTWKESEVDALTALAAHCVRQVFDGPVPTLIDPGGLNIEALGCDDLREFAVHVAAVAERHVVFPQWALLGASNTVDMWRAHCDVGTLEVLFRALAVGEHVDRNRPEAPPGWEFPGRRAEADSLARVLHQHIARGITCFRLVTSKGLWGDSLNRESGPVRFTVGDARCQILFESVGQTSHA